jgi:hypothetical protein
LSDARLVHEAFFKRLGIWHRKMGYALSKGHPIANVGASVRVDSGETRDWKRLKRACLMGL